MLVKSRSRRTELSADPTFLPNQHPGPNFDPKNGHFQTGVGLEWGLAAAPSQPRPASSEVKRFRLLFDPTSPLNLPFFNPQKVRDMITQRVRDLPQTDQLQIVTF